jgi:hypothetical protein
MSLFLTDALSEIYRWTDEQGKVHFPEKKPIHLESSKVKLKINTTKSVNYDRSVFGMGKRVVICASSG